MRFPSTLRCGQYFTCILRSAGFSLRNLIQADIKFRRPKPALPVKERNSFQQEFVVNANRRMKTPEQFRGTPMIFHGRQRRFARSFR
jgi:hypothetical protein